jgi:hypothetical protein
VFHWIRFPLFIRPASNSTQATNRHVGALWHVHVAKQATFLSSPASLWLWLPFQGWGSNIWILQWLHTISKPLLLVTPAATPKYSDRLGAALEYRVTAQPASSYHHRSCRGNILPFFLLRSWSSKVMQEARAFLGSRGKQKNDFYFRFVIGKVSEDPREIFVLGTSGYSLK